MNTKIFKKHCIICNKITNHIISKVNITRGVKLKCCECLEESPEYSHYNLLKK